MTRAVATLALAAALALGTTARAQTSPRSDEALAKASLLYVATVRKDGTQSAAAPVWFTVAPDRVVLIQTSPQSWKAKRIGRGSPAIVWIGAADGPAFIGKAELTRDPDVIRRIVEDYPQRYLLARLGFQRPTRQSFEDGTRVAIKLTPVRDVPGLTSKAGAPAPSLEAPSN